MHDHLKCNYLKLFPRCSVMPHYNVFMIFSYAEFVLKSYALAK